MDPQKIVNTYLYRDLTRWACLDYLNGLTPQEFAALTFVSLYNKLRRVIPGSLTNELVNEMKALYKRHGQESLKSLPVEETVAVDDDDEDIVQVVEDAVAVDDEDFVDAENLNQTLQKMSYPLRQKGYRKGMDEFWDRTPSDFMKNKPIYVDDEFKCPIEKCEFKAERSHVKIHFELKHPQTLAFYFDFPRYVLPVIARNKETLI